MANPKSSRRRRKRRGTQTGSIDTRGRSRQPRTRDEARAQARSRAKKKGTDRAIHGRLRKPTWTRALTLSFIAAACVFFMVAVIQKSPVGGSIGVAMVAFVIYAPALYFFESFMYRRRLAKYERERAAAKQKRING
jgi:Flp pilus assembly protein TadB